MMRRVYDVMQRAIDCVCRMMNDFGMSLDLRYHDSIPLLMARYLERIAWDQ